MVSRGRCRRGGGLGGYGFLGVGRTLGVCEGEGVGILCLGVWHFFC